MTSYEAKSLTADWRGLRAGRSVGMFSSHKCGTGHPMQLFPLLTAVPLARLDWPWVRQQKAYMPSGLPTSGSFSQCGWVSGLDTKGNAASSVGRMPFDCRLRVSLHGWRELNWEVYSSARRICRGWIRREIIIWIVNLLIFTVPAKLNVKGGDSPTLQGTETRISGGNRTWTRGCSTTPSVKFYTSHIWTEQTRNERPPCAIGATWDRPVKGLFLYPSHLRTHHRLCLATFVNLRSPSAWVSWMELSWHGKGLKSTTQTMKRYVSRCRTYRKIAMWKAGSDNRRPRSSTFSLIVFIRVR